MKTFEESSRRRTVNPTVGPEEPPSLGGTKWPAAALSVIARPFEIETTHEGQGYTVATPDRQLALWDIQKIMGLLKPGVLINFENDGHLYCTAYVCTKSPLKFHLTYGENG